MPAFGGAGHAQMFGTGPRIFAALPGRATVVVVLANDWRLPNSVGKNVK